MDSICIYKSVRERRLSIHSYVINTRILACEYFFADYRRRRRCGLSRAVLTVQKSGKNATRSVFTFLLFWRNPSRKTAERDGNFDLNLTAPNFTCWIQNIERSYTTRCRGYPNNNSWPLRIENWIFSTTAKSRPTSYHYVFDYYTHSTICFRRIINKWLRSAVCSTVTRKWI